MLALSVSKIKRGGGGGGAEKYENRIIDLKFEIAAKDTFPQMSTLNWQEHLIWMKATYTINSESN